MAEFLITTRCTGGTVHTVIPDKNMFVWGAYLRRIVMGNNADARRVGLRGIPENGTASRREGIMYEDKTLVCSECGAEFVFTAGEQEFYAERGFTNPPKRCKACRDARKNAQRPEREMFTAVCDCCGGEAKVPFQPRDGRPVYCSECFAKMRGQQSY